MAVPEEVAELVERFNRHREAYRSGQYNETQLRREFIDPFFKALGWDVDNVQGYAEPYKDVVHEDAIKIGGWTKAPDYCFRIGGARKFFVEAKKKWSIACSISTTNAQWRQCPTPRRGSSARSTQLTARLTGWSTSYMA